LKGVESSLIADAALLKDYYTALNIKHTHTTPPYLLLVKRLTSAMRGGRAWLTSSYYILYARD